MPLHWAADYIGKPYRRGADGPLDYDCAGLVCAVYAARLGIALSRHAFDERDTLAQQIEWFEDEASSARWAEVVSPQELDVALMTAARHPMHVGFYAQGKIVHAIENGGVVAMDPVRLNLSGFRILKWYRHVDRR